uniref:Ion transport domain-containing protein n=1 Tax=Chromera velia CCMP2878 TaxID=1169474 RepID=A0A0G4IF70_9ALVE|eukprot:Cvel_2435.t1-p1 / transcript=Cvel_2435.t1 / gene=Cvel_2435 / organism=Chromera_velia_CCMP2878 / gene_product=hypothetical protein / transcript_product=hypothetical protein / location=Cvel_scaffold95:97788-98812(-) / protein_length=291 / sequence_SO=supercontig / SO=protein_coding / is_pseudo=false
MWVHRWVIFIALVSHAASTSTADPVEFIIDASIVWVYATGIDFITFPRRPVLRILFTSVVKLFSFFDLALNLLLGFILATHESPQKQTYGFAIVGLSVGLQLPPTVVELENGELNRDERVKMRVINLDAWGRAARAYFARALACCCKVSTENLVTKRSNIRLEAHKGKETTPDPSPKSTTAPDGLELHPEACMSEADRKPVVIFSLRDKEEELGAVGHMTPASLQTAVAVGEQVHILHSNGEDFANSEGDAIDEEDSACIPWDPEPAASSLAPLPSHPPRFIFAPVKVPDA